MPEVSVSGINRVAAVTGIGLSEVGRPASLSPIRLTVDACIEAMADAGLAWDDIDGISTYPGLVDDASGFSPVGIDDVRLALGLKTNWHCGGAETPGQLGAVINAVAAIAAGLAKHVLVFRTVAEYSARSWPKPPPGDWSKAPRLMGVHQWTGPFGAMPPPVRFAMQAQRYFHETGTGPEQLAQVAINARRNATLNPWTILRSHLTLDEYMTGRMIASPLRLFDCDVPADGSVAVVISRADLARHGRNPRLLIDSVGAAVHSRESWFRPEDLTCTSSRDAADMMWRGTTLRPSDIDFIQVYDGFSIFVPLWIEALGFCGRGEAGAFIDGGRRIALDGELPTNTSGGQLAAGRLHGLNFLHEACVQLWGRGGDRQVAGNPRAGIATAGHGAGFSGALLVVCDE